MNLLRGTLKSFNAVTYKATVQITGSRQTYLADVPVNRAIPSGEMVAGRTCAILFYDAQTPGDGMVVGVF